MHGEVGAPASSRPAEEDLRYEPHLAKWIARTELSGASCAVLSDSSTHAPGSASVEVHGEVGAPACSRSAARPQLSDEQVLEQLGDIFKDIVLPFTDASLRRVLPLADAIKAAYMRHKYNTSRNPTPDHWQECRQEIREICAIGLAEAM